MMFNYRVFWVAATAVACVFTSPLRTEDLPGADKYGDRVVVKKYIL